MFNFLEREIISEEVQLVINSIQNNPDEWQVERRPTRAINIKRNIKVALTMSNSRIIPANKESFSRLPLNDKEEAALRQTVENLHETRNEREKENQLNQSRRAVKEAFR